jgi:hypothetical protein
MINNEDNRQAELNNNTTTPSNMPETVTNSLYTPGFLRNYIGKLLKVEFLIGTNSLQDRIGILLDVGASYIVLRSVQDNNLLYCDIFSIKFVTISNQSYIFNNTPYQYNTNVNSNMLY